MSDALVFDATSRRFGRRWALRDLSLCCVGGAVTCLVGPNGAGKSTALALAARLLPPTAGRVTHSDPSPALGYLPQISVFPAVLRAGEVFEFTARACASTAETRTCIRELSGLDAVLDQPVGELSGGWVRRLGLACALLPQTGEVVLDEPFVGLDPDTLDRLVHHIEYRVAAGAVVLLSTHDFETVDRLAPHLVVLDDGRVAGTGAPGQTPARVLYRTVLGTEPRTASGTTHAP